MRLISLKNILAISIYSSLLKLQLFCFVFLALKKSFCFLNKSHREGYASFFKNQKIFHVSSKILAQNSALPIMTSIALLTSFSAAAEMIVRDSEVESVIFDTINPVAQAASIGKINIILLQNDEVNAFTPGGNEVFIHTGLITHFPDPDVLRGVVAHEIGHIMGHHNSRQMENVSNQSKLSLASLAIGLGAAMASGDPRALLAGGLGGLDVAEKSLLKYSRTYESSADQAAFKLLEKSGNSALGLQKLMQHFLSETRSNNANKYLLTHPLSSERLETVNNFLLSSHYKTSTNSNILKRRFERIAYKLFAFTNPSPEAVLQKISGLKDQELALYTKAICYMRLGNQQKSIEAVDGLLKTHADDPYYNELKGQILFEFGKKESIGYFVTASNLVPNDALMKLNVAVVALNVYRDRPAELAKFIHYLKFVQQKEPESLAAYYYLSIYYETMSNPPLAQIYLALYYDKQENKMGRPLAKSALKALKAETPEWYWAKDIIEKDLKD